ncbi:hypothetical protein WA026_012400 [Henosepilachna vigintioctopunctata]|uniref:Uncharacterized protein n=1 Tax=Henosepilachna vigintioctopunctata TaxID=420089 RepID=A0AAW1UXR5_9CUCU
MVQTAKDVRKITSCEKTVTAFHVTVIRDKCNKCDANYFDSGSHGCKNCGCFDVGSIYNTPSCDPDSGTCHCKENVEGKRCRECKPGFFNLDKENYFGCTPCFCYGHSSQCISASGYFRHQITSSFDKSVDRWKAIDYTNRPVNLQYNALSQSVSVDSGNDEIVYFSAPERYLGDQRASYNQILQFKLRIGKSMALSSAEDVIIEGAAEKIVLPIFAQQHNLPSTEAQLYRSDFTKTKTTIKATYAPQDVTYLDDVKLETASRGIASTQPAYWVEQCKCPDGYVGQFCESCATGFKHSRSSSGPFIPCIPCDCNKHTDECDSDTGKCRCRHNTAGDNCELCARGFYGNALGATKDDCQPCGCPQGGPYIQIDDESGQGCQVCNCDPIASLNQTCVIFTGQCFCRPGVIGLHCDHCEAKKYGFSIEGCKDCECDEIGSKDLQCDASGQCPCLENVEGRQCDRCKENKYDRQRGCVECPDCYNLVQDAARLHNEKLLKLKDDLEEIEQRPTVIKDDEFPEELKNLQTSINELHTDTITFLCVSDDGSYLVAADPASDTVVWKKNMTHGIFTVNFQNTLVHLLQCHFIQPIQVYLLHIQIVR